MPHPIISRFPALALCSASITFDWDRSYVGDLLKACEQDGYDFGLAETELALVKLLTRFKPEDLAEQIQDLFSSDPVLSQAMGKSMHRTLCVCVFRRPRTFLFSRLATGLRCYATVRLPRSAIGDGIVVRCEACEWQRPRGGAQSHRAGHRELEDRSWHQGPADQP